MDKLDRDRPYLSWSRIRSYSTCSLQYFFRYVSKEKPAFTPAALAFGVALHSAIENALRATVAGTEFTIDDLLGIFSEMLDQQAQTAPIKWPAKQDRASAIELARRMLTAWLAVPRTGRIVSIEEPVSMTLPSGMRILGRVDFVVEEDDHVVLGDIKTAARVWGEEEIWRGQDQLLLYRDALRSKLEALGKPIKLAWHVVTKTQRS